MSCSHRTGSWLSFSAICAVANRTVSALYSPLMNYSTHCQKEQTIETINMMNTYQSECFVRAIDDSFPVLLVLLRIAEPFLLLLQVGWVGFVCSSSKMLRGWNTIVHPGGAPNEISYCCSGQLCHLRHNLDAGASVANDRNALVRIIKVVVPAGRVRYVALEVGKAWDLGPGWIAATMSGSLAITYSTNGRSTYTRFP